MAQPPEQKRAYACASRLLARREHSCRELIHKLNVRGFSSVAQPVAMQLIDAGLLSDNRFAEMVIYSRMRQGYGVERIRYELQNHQITAEIITDALDMIPMDGWLSCMHDQLARRFTSGIPSLTVARRHLRQRGFPTAHIALLMTALIDQDLAD